MELGRLSTAFQIGAYGLIALQYDFRHASYMDDVHSLRAGIEVIPVLGMYINAGYAYESTFKPATDIVPAQLATHCRCVLTIPPICLIDNPLDSDSSICDLCSRVK